jgi:hypothetical protein
MLFKNGMRSAIAGLAIAMTSTMPLLAKGPTVRLAISGPGLAESLIVTDPVALKATVYGGEFMEQQQGPVPEPPRSLPRYKVQFYVAPPRSEVRVMYEVDYVWDDAVGRALIYLPGSRLNQSTILRSGEGKWFYAASGWGAALHTAIQRAAPTGTPTTSLDAAP